MADMNYNKLVAQIFGVVLALVGILGFVMNPILGIFHVSLIHNVVHLLSGIVLLAAAFIDGGKNSRMANMVLGVVYALVTILGFAAMDLTNSLLGGTTAAPAMDTADNLLHALLAVVFLGVSFAFKDTAMGGMGASKM